MIRIDQKGLRTMSYRWGSDGIPLPCVLVDDFFFCFFSLVLSFVDFEVFCACVEPTLLAAPSVIYKQMILVLGET
jgi:hypothetical protein